MVALGSPGVGCWFWGWIGTENVDDIDLNHVQTDPLFNLKKKLKNGEDEIPTGDDPYSQIGTHVIT